MNAEIEHFSFFSQMLGTDTVCDACASKVLGSVTSIETTTTTKKTKKCERIKTLIELKAKNKLFLDQSYCVLNYAY